MRVPFYIAVIAAISSFVLCLAPGASWGATDTVPTAMIVIPAGVVDMQADPQSGPQDNSGNTASRVQVPAFHMDKSPVTTAHFKSFVEKTGYRTTAEGYGDSAVLNLETGMWSLVKGAMWAQPLGPDKQTAPSDHPVTHISWFDAVAYCEHTGKRLPTEAEWEHAARNGRNDQATYAFGNDILREGDFLANIWTGIFPMFNSGEDGFLYTSPVGQFGANEIGLTDMAGNVWEWSADWEVPKGRSQAGFTPNKQSQRLQKGGSYLCDPKVCHGFRINARSQSTPDSSHMHVGFRCARDL